MFAQLLDNQFMLIFGCGILALLYGILTARQVLSANAGTPKMQEIAAAIQEGARAYLNRQYMTIALVGVVICVALGLFLGMHVAVGFIIGAVLAATLARVAADQSRTAPPTTPPL